MRDTIAAHIQRACDLADRQVEKMARDIMRKHPNVTAFIMAMGLATFEIKGESDSLGLEDRAYFGPLKRFIDRWDDMLGITGSPMWIKGPDGPVIREWGAAGTPGHPGFD